MLSCVFLEAFRPLPGDQQPRAHSGSSEGGLWEVALHQRCLPEGPAGEPDLCQTWAATSAGAAGLGREGTWLWSSPTTDAQMPRKRIFSSLHPLSGLKRAGLSWLSWLLVLLGHCVSPVWSYNIKTVVTMWRFYISLRMVLSRLQLYCWLCNLLLANKLIVACYYGLCLITFMYLYVLFLYDVQELEKKFQQTAAYRNMKEILTKKNEQIKEIRKRLQRWVFSKKG